MSNRVRGLVGRVLLTALSAGIAHAGIVRGNQRAPEHGLRQILDYIAHCRECSENEKAANRAAASPGNAGLASLPPALVEHPAYAGRIDALWAVTVPPTNRPEESTASGFRPSWPANGRAGSDIPYSLAYLGGASVNAVGMGRGHGPANGRSKGNGSLAAVPEPAPILLIGTILLAMFSIARLRFGR